MQKQTLNTKLQMSSRMKETEVFYTEPNKREIISKLQLAFTLHED